MSIWAPRAPSVGAAGREGPHDTPRVGADWRSITNVLTIVVITIIYLPMVKRLKDELKQSRPFGSVEEEVLLGLARTADALERGLVQVFKGSSLTGTQYNVLRILRGAGASGLPCGEIADRMVTRDPDLTRLLDRLEKRHLVTRARDDADRRVVTTRITQSGLSLLDQLAEPLAEVQKRLLGHMAEERLRRLADLLDEARSTPE